MPPFFLGVGDRDPLRDDTERFSRALARLGVQHEAKRYAGGVHGFHVLLQWAKGVNPTKPGPEDTAATSSDCDVHATNPILAQRATASFA